MIILKKNMKPGNQISILSFIIFIITLFYSIEIFSKNLIGESVLLGALDKVTAKFSEFEVRVGESATFGSLSIKVFECRKRPPEEIPEDFILLKIEDKVDENNPVLVFSGWMLSSSPSLSPLEHSTYDIWAKECRIK